MCTRILLWILLPAVHQTEVTGTVRYENRLYTERGFTGETEYIPARQAEIELHCSSHHTTTAGTTNGDGEFRLSPTEEGTHHMMGLHIHTRRDSINPGFVRTQVMNNSKEHRTYSYASAPISVDLSKPVSFPPVRIPLTDPAAEAFNIFDCLVYALQFVHHLNEDVKLPQLPPDLLNAYWEPGAIEGTRFDPSSMVLLIRGTLTNNDACDDDVILHEAGHFVARRWSKDDAPEGQSHRITEQLDPRLAWSEGWAHFFSSAARSFANRQKSKQSGSPSPYPKPSTYVDLHKFGASTFDIEEPSYPTKSLTIQNELAIATFLWDIFDTTNEAFDSLPSGRASPADTWAVLRSEVAQERNPVTAEAFIKGWQKRFGKSSPETLALNRILADRQICLEDEEDHPPK